MRNLTCLYETYFVIEFWRRFYELMTKLKIIFKYKGTRRATNLKYGHPGNKNIIKPNGSPWRVITLLPADCVILIPVYAVIWIIWSSRLIDISFIGKCTFSVFILQGWDKLIDTCLHSWYPSHGTYKIRVVERRYVEIC